MAGAVLGGPEFNASTVLCRSTTGFLLLFRFKYLHSTNTSLNIQYHCVSIRFLCLISCVLFWCICSALSTTSTTHPPTRCFICFINERTARDISYSKYRNYPSCTRHYKLLLLLLLNCLSFTFLILVIYLV